MKVELGTIEVSEAMRRAVRSYNGKTGLATEKEVRDLYKMLADYDFEEIVAGSWEEEKARRKDQGR